MEEITLILRSDLQKFRAIEALKNYKPDPDHPWQVSFSEFELKKTDLQRHYFHVLCREVGKHFGYTEEEMKQEAKRAVLGVREYVGLDGSTQRYIPSSESALRRKYSLLIDWLHREAAEEGLHIPDPRY